MIEITTRDYEILRLVFRFRFCLGRHIRTLGNFSGLRAADRRLKVLVESGYLMRKKYLYGIPYLYTLTHKGRVLLGVNKRADTIRLERITHDIYVLEAVIFFVKKFGVSLQDIRSEKELHIQDGFGDRKHHPDFVAALDGTTIAIEVELNPKAKLTLENNIRDNYLNYDRQIWITNDSKITAIIQNFVNEYPNIEMMELKGVLEYDKF